jgi:uncharacterized protein (DUF342 family)
VQSEQEKTTKLVSQFATLAARLGITLPPELVQKLTSKTAAQPIVAENNAQLEAEGTWKNLSTESSTTNVPAGVVPPSTASLHGVASSDAASCDEPKIQQIQSSAAEAIAAVSSKRVAEEKPYSKRRKKPRLPDCERKLAELKAENEMLKRHLDNISNKTVSLDKERINAEHKMRTMLQQEAPDSELEPIVKNFTEMYSDYGRKRHDELNFHLQQLQRCGHIDD